MVPSSVLSQNPIQDRRACSEKSTLTSEPPSRLLRLPAELRNRIWEYSLTTNDILKYNLVPAQGKPLILLGHKKKKEFNLVKYVSRQLYAETAGLEIKFNTIIFGDNYPEYRGPAQSFVNFVSRCAPAKAAWFADVVIRTGGDMDHSIGEIIEPATVLLQLAEFCHAHPRTKVSYHILDLNCKWRPVRNFFQNGTYLKTALRHDTSYYGLVGIWQVNIELAKQWTDSNGVKRLKARNLNFWPASKEVSEDFKATVRQEYTDNTVSDQYIALAQEWVEIGF